MAQGIPFVGKGDQSNFPQWQWLPPHTKQKRPEWPTAQTPRCNDSQKVLEWISSTDSNATSRLAGAEATDNDVLRSTIEVDYGDFNVHTSISSEDDPEASITQSSIELSMSLKFRQELRALPLNVFERYQQRYPSFTGSLDSFLKFCTFIEWFMREPLVRFHPYLWDDFFRFHTEYLARGSTGKSRRIREGDPLGLYLRDVTEPLYSGNILNRKTLPEALLIDPMRVEFHRTQRKARKDEWCSKYERTRLHDMLQQCIREDMAPFEENLDIV